MLPWLAGAAAGHVTPEAVKPEFVAPASVDAAERMPEAVRREMDQQMEEFCRDNPGYRRFLESG